MAREPQQLFRDVLLQRFNDPDLRDFVQSTLNILSDGIDIDNLNGLKLEAKGTSQRLVSFYEKIREKSPLWEISFSHEQQKNAGLHVTEGGITRFFIKKGGNVGIGTATPSYKLQVEGMVASEGRVGTYFSGFFPADGEWHSVVHNLDGCQAFEAFAHINDGNSRRYALTFAMLLMSDENGFKNQVKTVDAASPWLWGSFWNRIRFRWSEDKLNSTPESKKYKLEIRSKSRYGMPNGSVPNIFCRLAKVWDKFYDNQGQDYAAPPRSTQTIVAAPQPEKKAQAGQSGPQKRSGGGIVIKKND